MASSSVGSTDKIPKYEPLLTDLPKAKARDWTFIYAIIAASIGALMTIVAYACSQGIFPNELLGGKWPTFALFLVGLGITAPSGYVAYNRYMNPPN